MLLHLITLCIGLIIAFGLQQIVDLFLRRRRARREIAAEFQGVQLPPASQSGADTNPDNPEPPSSSDPLP